MANVKLEWSQATFAESFSIYRSSTPMDTANMPAPLVAGITKTYYFDASVIVGGTYFYRVGAVRSNQELISDEVEVLANAPVVNDIFWPNVELLIFADATTFPSGNLADSSSRVRAVSRGGSPQIIDSEYLYDAGAIYATGAVQYWGFDGSIGIGNGDFTIECFLKIATDSSEIPNGANIFDLNSIKLRVVLNSSTYKNFQIYLGSGATINLTPLVESPKGAWHHFCLMRESGILYAFIDGVLSASVANTYNLTSYTWFSSNTSAGRGVKGYYNGCRVTKSARYSKNGFITPDSKFPTS